MVLPKSLLIRRLVPLDPFGMPQNLREGSGLLDFFHSCRILRVGGSNPGPYILDKIHFGRDRQHALAPATEGPAVRPGINLPAVCAFKDSFPVLSFKILFQRKTELLQVGRP